MLSSYKTAIARTRPSAPARLVFDRGWLFGRMMNWGVGKAWLDTVLFESHHWVDSCESYDPVYAPMRPSGIYDTIYCGYVANTLTPIRRAGLYMDILQFMSSESTAIFAVRADKVSGAPFEDGVITSKDTFQRSYTVSDFADELAEFFPRHTVMREGHYLIGLGVK